ncbi:hypothetical protein [uncultured Hyphomicrobium sp.]|uniref:hypothetical protein n=1 Tax=uncultured Hyphomicrobium sp. TaxID=194373 RepID=UPI0025F32FAD|nr:hypothetical protein [uncultured Hyphomicrobium sp.]
MSARTINRQGRSVSSQSLRCGAEARKTVEAVLSPGVTFEALVAHERTPPSLAADMHRAMFALWKTGRYSMPEIARFLGRSNHTTVLWGVDRERAKEGHPIAIARVAWSALGRGKCLYEIASDLGVMPDLIDECIWNWRARVTQPRAA